MALRMEMMVLRMALRMELVVLMVDPMALMTMELMARMVLKMAVMAPKVEPMALMRVDPMALRMELMVLGKKVLWETMQKWMEDKVQRIPMEAMGMMEVEMAKKLN